MDKYEELKMYADLECTETGEMCQLLLDLVNYHDFISKDFGFALEAEIDLQLQNFREYAKIVETEETVTHKYKTLEWS